MDDKALTEYRDLLKQHGLVVELADDANALLAAVCSARGTPEAVTNMIANGKFTNGKSHVLLLPPDDDLIAALDKAVMKHASGGDLSAAAIALSAEIMGVASSMADDCDRSPCGTASFDPKVSEGEIKAARALVGTPKLKRSLEVRWHDTGQVNEKGKKILRGEVLYHKRTIHHVPGDGRWPLTVAFGLGVDSTAVLVGLVQLWRETKDDRWRPDHITFADTGAEKRATYAWLKKFDKWLRDVGFPGVTVVGWATEFGGKARTHWGSNRTLEQKCLVNQTMPAITYMRTAECSMTWKQQPQHVWMKQHSGLFPVEEGTKIVRAIGYDVSEEARLTKKTGTYRLSDEWVAEAKVKKASGDDEDVPDDITINRPPKYSEFEFWMPLMEWGWDRARCIAEIEAELGSRPPKSSCTFCAAMRPVELVSLALTEPDLFERAIFMEQVALFGRSGRGTDAPIKGLGISWSWYDFAAGDVSSLVNMEVIGNDGKPIKRLLSDAKLKAIRQKAKDWIKASPKKPHTIDTAKTPAAKKLAAFKDVLGTRTSGRMDWDRFDVLKVEGRANGPRRLPIADE